MDFYVLNRSFETIGIIDNYTSVIWTLRYNDVGDFEIYVKSTPEIIEMCKVANFVVRGSDNTVMIIRSVKQSDSSENGNYITITGVSIESVLSQRVVWQGISVSGRIEEAIYLLLKYNLIPTSENQSYRHLDGFSLAPLKHLTDEIEMTNFTGENLLDVVKNLCDMIDYGFRITFSNGSFMFEIYRGVDRSRNQTENPYVIFDAESMSEMSYTHTIENYKNAALIGGDGEFINRKYAEFGGAFGLDRYEIFVDASDVSQNDLLISAGKAALQEYKKINTLDAEITNTYTYGVDYQLGDIVQLENRSGISATARVIEIIQSIDDSGIYVIPTFSEWEVTQ